MGVPKGTDNFKAHRVAKQTVGLELLRVELDKALRRKARYPAWPALIADMERRTGMHRTTLGRNPGYRCMLEEFYEGQAGGSTYVLEKDASPDMLRAKLIDSQMEIGRLRNALSVAERANVAKVSADKSSIPQLSESAAHIAFVDTVWVLRAVLERINLDGTVFEIDLERCEIRDMAAAPGRRVVANGQRLKPFCGALSKLLEQER